MATETGTTSSTGSSSSGESSSSSTSSATDTDTDTDTDTSSSSSATDSTSSGPCLVPLTSDPSLDTSTSACLQAPDTETAEVSACLSLVPRNDGCSCRDGPPSPAAILFALLICLRRRRSRREVIDDLDATGRLPHDVVARLRAGTRRPPAVR